MGMRLAALYTPDLSSFQYSGIRESGDLLPFVGAMRAKVVSGEPGKGFKAPHNPLIKWVFAGDDEDTIGATLRGNINTSGVADKTNEALEKRTADLLLSCGVFEDAKAMDGFFRSYIQSQMQAGVALDQIELSEEWIIQQCVGKTCYIDVGCRDLDNGGQSSSPDGFMTKATYEEKKKSPGIFRQPRPAPKAAKAATGAPVGATPIAPPPSLGGPSVPGVPGVPAPTGAPRLPAPPAYAAPAAPPPAPPPAFAPPAPNGMAPPAGFAPPPPPPATLR